jgi:hypothetical protein
MEQYSKYGIASTERTEHAALSADSIIPADVMLTLGAPRLW